MTFQILQDMLNLMLQLFCIFNLFKVISETAYLNKC